MNVDYYVKRYGSFERRSMEIDIEQLAKDDLIETMGSIGGFEDDAPDTIEILYDELAKDLITEHL